MTYEDQTEQCERIMKNCADSFLIHLLLDNHKQETKRMEESMKDPHFDPMCLADYHNMIEIRKQIEQECEKRIEKDKKDAEYW
jgi:hypothetical protein